MKWNMILGLCLVMSLFLFIIGCAETQSSPPIVMKEESSSSEEAEIIEGLNDVDDLDSLSKELDNVTEEDLDENIIG